MKKIKVSCSTKHMLADLVTPVSIFLTARKLYKNTVLLESSDYHGNENSYSFICLEPIADFTVNNFIASITYPNDSVVNTKIENPIDFSNAFTAFIDSFDIEQQNDVPINGIFGYSEFDAVQFFETIRFSNKHDTAHSIPMVKYGFYKYIIAINHYKNDLHIVENLIHGEKSEIAKIEEIILSNDTYVEKFSPDNKEKSNLTDEEYMKLVTLGKEHCYRGDVFQIVLSRQFSQTYKGDDFNVYRTLRSINPSPYLFYFDYDDYRIFGSSPEAQIKIKDERATINPIAGTFRRTGNDEQDKKLAKELSEDKKENAEHVMLVDLARNDLSRQATDVRVDSYREIQYYSHVLHMVSTVSGKLNKPDGVVDMLMATFPAGTLSGAPKYKALELIDKYENQNRGYYGGAIGFIGFDGTLNHAIMIRTFLSKENTLYYQAGAGIVSVSNEESELQEVHNKLGALKKAINLAKEL
jgi:anthranilate synthase component 1